MPFRRRTREKFVFALKVLLFLGLVAFQWKLPELPWVEKLPEALVTAILFYATAHLIISFLRITITLIYIKKQKMGDEQTDNFLIGIRQIANLISLFTFLFAISLFFEIDLKELFTSLSIIAAALAILSKDYISNVINGMILMFANQVSINDYVKIGSHRGKIVDITLVNTHLVTDEEDLIYIPNNMLFTIEVVNYTKRVVNRVGFEFEMKYDSMTSVEDLESYLTTSVESYSDYIVEGSHNLRTNEVKNDGLSLNFQYVSTEPNREVEKQVRKTLARAVVKYVGEK